MDKIKPLLVYKFWMILGVVLLLPPIGWWMSSGKLKAEIDKRTGELDGVIKSIPAGQGVPNDDWANQAQKYVENRGHRNQLALKVLWDSQVKTRVWPGPVAKYMAKCAYRGELTDRIDREKVPDLYRESYDAAVEQVWRIPFPKQDLADPNRAQIVDFPLQRVPRVPATTWRGIVPTWGEMWNASEDLWLLEQIFNAVQRTNSFSTNLVDANVKQIRSIELFGGKRLQLNEAPSGVGAAAAPGMPMVAPGAPGSASLGSLAVTTADFSLTEEYAVSAGPGGAGNNMMAPMAPGAPAATPGAAANPDEGRYVQDTPAFRTRGFKLKVIVRQQNAMELVREILNSQYPVEITRMQQYVLNAPFGSLNADPAMSMGLPGAPSGFEGSASPMPPILVEGSLQPGAPGMTSGFPGSGAADALGPPGPLAGASPQDVLVYQDPHLVELVIVGELYIYKQPKLPEADPNAAPANPMGTPALDPTGAPAVDPTAPGTVDPAGTPAATPGVPPVANPAAAGTPVNPAATPAAPSAATPAAPASDANKPAPATDPASQ